MGSGVLRCKSAFEISFDVKARTRVGNVVTWRSIGIVPLFPLKPFLLTGLLPLISMFMVLLRVWSLVLARHGGLISLRGGRDIIAVRVLVPVGILSSVIGPSSRGRWVVGVRVVAVVIVVVVMVRQCRRPIL